MGELSVFREAKQVQAWQYVINPIRIQLKRVIDEVHTDGQKTLFYLVVSAPIRLWLEPL